MSKSGKPVIKAALRFIHKMEDALLVAALASMLVMAVIQISLRNFFDVGLFWAESFLRILVLWIAILGAMVATRESNHISIDILSRYLGRTQRKIVFIVVQVFSAVICGIVAYYAYIFVQFEYEDQTVAFAEVPTWICQSIIPFGFLVMSIRFLGNGFGSLSGNRS